MPKSHTILNTFTKPDYCFWFFFFKKVEFSRKDLKKKKKPHSWNSNFTLLELTRFWWSPSFQSFQSQGETGQLSSVNSLSPIQGSHPVFSFPPPLLYQSIIVCFAPFLFLQIQVGWCLNSDSCERGFALSSTALNSYCPALSQSI